VRDRCFTSVFFNVDSGAPFSSAQKVFLPTVQHDLITHFYFLREVSILLEPLFILQHLFCSRRLACLCLLSGYSKFMLGTHCHIPISKHSHCSGNLFSSLMPYLTLYFIVSAKKLRFLQNT